MTQKRINKLLHLESAHRFAKSPRFTQDSQAQLVDCHDLPLANLAMTDLAWIASLFSLRSNCLAMTMFHARQSNPQDLLKKLRFANAVKQPFKARESNRT